ncbi:MAG: hypothetical protein AB7K24_09110 [Gemmataceae bacterium]
MKTHILKGSKQQIVERLVQIRGEVREVIVFEEEPPPPPDPMPKEAEDIFAEMNPFMVDVYFVDDSREAV